MVPLKTNRLIFMWFLIFPREKNTSLLIAFAQYAFAVLCFVATVSGFFGSIIFVNRYIKTDLDAALFSVLQIAALFSATYMQIFGHILRKKFIAMIECFSKFYKSRKYFQFS